MLQKHGCASAGILSRYRTVAGFFQARRPLVIILCGAPGTGKTSIAQQLGARLNLPNVLQTDLLLQVKTMEEGEGGGVEAAGWCSGQVCGLRRRLLRQRSYSHALFYPRCFRRWGPSCFPTLVRGHPSSPSSRPGAGWFAISSPGTLRRCPPSGEVHAPGAAQSPAGPRAADSHAPRTHNDAPPCSV